jgi:hypothetical protein
MRRRLSRTLLALVPLVLAAACQDPDVGQKCTLDWGDDSANPPPTAQSATVDYFESGNIACDGLVCIISPATTGDYASSTPREGYCSKACVSDDDCYKSETGLVCRQIVLDPYFVSQMDPATKDRYLGDVAFSSYCALPQ